MKKKRILVLSDLHCGHAFGLTPPAYQTPLTPGLNDEDGDPYGLWQKAAIMQREMWEFVVGLVSRRKFDVCVLNGDAVDGKGEKSGGTELLTTDRKRQADMAAAVLRAVKADVTFMTFGTPYHTGTSEDWELSVCDKYPVERIRSQLFLEAFGVIFDFRHHIGGTSVPYGVHTAPTKQRIINVLAADQGQVPRADITVRSHVHRFQYEETRSGASLTTPGLQAYTKFGARRCDGDIDIGLSWFDVYEDGTVNHTVELLEMECRKPKPISV